MMKVKVESNVFQSCATVNDSPL
ncbi:unnamed protein product, partial [Rotaria magnacalcarata]